MKYMLLIYGNEQAWGTMTQEDGQKMMAEYGSYTKEIIEAGQFVSGAPLQPTSTATSVQVRDGKRVTTDGPFAETREQLGGYYLVEAKDLDEAIGLAARIPGAKYGTIEVRPVMDME